jgi:hypothetical protein
MLLVMVERVERALLTQLQVLQLTMVAAAAVHLMEVEVLVALVEEEVVVIDLLQVLHQYQEQLTQAEVEVGIMVALQVQAVQA